MAVSPKRKYYEGCGSRKRAKARVRIYEGSEVSVINGKPLEDYYKGREQEEASVLRPLVVSGLADKMFFSANVSGGGTTGWSGAVCLGLANAILKYDEGHRQALIKESLLTRDMREKERKKYFLRKARKASQFSKR